MNAYESREWAYMEDAVVRKMGIDEESALATLICSYMIRGGMSDSLAAFMEDLGGEVMEAPLGPPIPSPSLSSSTKGVATAANGVPPNGATVPQKHTVSSDKPSAPDREVDAWPLLLSRVEERKRAQMLCLDGDYVAAAALVDSSSVIKVKLLCLAALDLLATGENLAALALLSEEVAFLVPTCEDPCTANALLAESMTAIIGRQHSITWLRLCNRKLALEVNEALLEDTSESKLSVLFAWDAWQRSRAEARP